jgi:hypothetical protein
MQEADQRSDAYDTGMFFFNAEKSHVHKSSCTLPNKNMLLISMETWMFR